jgi:hypothetical protein
MAEVGAVDWAKGSYRPGERAGGDDASQSVA